MRKVPTKVKKLQGTYNVTKDVDNPIIPELMGEAPTPPEGLGAEGKKMWESLVKNFDQIGMLSELDLGMLEKYCFLEDQFQHLRAKLEDEGYNESSQKNGIYSALSSILTHMCRIGGKFGLTPADRDGINLPKRPEKDGFDELMAK